MAGGRPIGSRNGTTASAKAAIEECFKMLGGVGALYEWALENKTDFYRVIYPKLIPLTLANDKDNPITVVLESILKDIDGESAALPENQTQVIGQELAAKQSLLH